MGRDAAALANKNAKTGQAYSGTLMGEGQNTLGTLAPALTQEATNPTGFAPTDLAAMNTASQQSLGGANASAAGQGALMEARTRNAGAANPAIEESARNAMRQGSQNALGIQSANAQLKNQQQQAGISGLSQLYGQNTNAALNALGLSTNAAGVENQADAQTNQAAQGWAGLGLNAFLAPPPRPCWVAAELYGGWKSPEVPAIRAWFMARPFLCGVYRLTGEWWAQVIQTHSTLRKVTKMAFDWILRQTNYGR